MAGPKIPDESVGSVFLKGSGFPQEQNFEEHYDPENGYTRIIEWEGIIPDRILNYARLYQRAGCATAMSVRYGFGRLTVNDQTGSVTIDRWEVGAEQVSKSVLMNPWWIATISNDAHIRIITDYINQAGDNADYDTAYAALAGNDFAQRELDLIAKGGADYEDEIYVLRHTTNVRNRYDSNISDVNKGCIYTFAQLFSEVLSSNLWVFPMPGRLVYKLQNIVAPADKTGFQWGWLKSASTEQSAANNRINIATLYKLDQWSLARYPLAT